MDERVTAYIAKKEQWSKELTLLRTIINELPLEETVKWGAPTYTYQGKNIIGIAGFKNYFGIWFFQGGLLKDEANVLMNAQEGKTQAMRQWRFHTQEEVDVNLLKAYILEAIENQKAGKEIKPNRTKPLVIPPELQEVMSSNDNFKVAFEELTKGKQREYADHISEAKREATKLKRIEKIIPMVLRGVGLHDKYKNC